MKKIKYLIIVMMLATLSSCIKEGEDITDNELKIHNFNELPIEVQKIIDTNIEAISNSEVKQFYSTNRNIKVQHYQKKTHRNWLKEVSNNDEYFKIGSDIYRVKGNRGSPFILNENKIFYLDLNLDDLNYKTHKYYSITIK